MSTAHIYAKDYLITNQMRKLQLIFPFLGTCEVGKWGNTKEKSITGY